MKSIRKQWLASAPWDSVLEINKALCQAQQSQFTLNEKAVAEVRKCWEAAVKNESTLPEALEACRHCYELAPFVFNNGNTFASVAKTLIEEWLKQMAPVEAQIVRNTVAHYVAGLVGKRELLDILKHFEAALQPAVAARPAQAPATESSPAPAAPQIQAAPARS